MLYSDTIYGISLTKSTKCTKTTKKGKENSIQTREKIRQYIIISAIDNKYGIHCFISLY